MSIGAFAVASLAGARRGSRDAKLLPYNAAAAEATNGRSDSRRRRCMRPGFQILTGHWSLPCGALPGALAADPPRFDVTPMVGYRMGGEFEVVDPEATSGTSIDLDEGTSFGIDLGLYRDSNSFYELLYSRQESGFDSPDASIGSVDLATEYLHFGETLLFPDDTGMCPGFRSRSAPLRLICRVAVMIPRRSFPRASVAGFVCPSTTRSPPHCGRTRLCNARRFGHGDFLRRQRRSELSRPDLRQHVFPGRGLPRSQLPVLKPRTSHRLRPARRPAGPARSPATRTPPQRTESTG